MNTRNQMTTLPALFALATMTLLIAAGSASAQIVIDDFGVWTGGEPTTVTFNAAGSDKLVVLVTGEHGFNQTGNGSVNGVTYDGVPMVELINRPTIKPVDDDPGTPEDETVLADDTWNAIYYLDYPATTTGLISAATVSRSTISVFALSGTAPGAGNTAISPRDSSSVQLTTSADSIVFASYGMGGSGNTAKVDNVVVDAPLTFATKAHNGGSRWWDGHVTAYANDVAAGTATYSVTDNNPPEVGTGRTGAHLIAAELLLGIPHNLTLRVDPVTGDTTIVGDATRDYAIDYYQITSEGGSLDSNSWSSLADQDYEGSGPPSGFGDGWEEAGGAGSHALAEAFLLGSSPIGAGESIGLGQGYDTDVNAQDLVFKYRTEFGKIIDGLVEYATSAKPGDANLDGIVDAADYVAIKRNLGMAAGAKYGDGDFDLDGDVDWDDMGILRGALSQGGAAGTIPEPGSAALLTCGLGWLLRRRRS
jgi:hypothetical protein